MCLSGPYRWQASSHNVSARSRRRCPDREPVGAGLPAMNDDAVPDQNSSVLESEICRESPIDTKNRLAAEV